MRRHASTTAEVVSFSAGAIVGAGLALLYAPKTGHDTREKIADATEDAISKMKGITADAQVKLTRAQEKLNRKLERGRDYAEEKAATLSSVVEDTREQYH